jgi:hypothetical protein
VKEKSMGQKIFVVVCLLFFVCGCANVDVTKTAKGFNAPTDPNDVEILQTKPDRPFTELGSITSTGWAPSDTAKLHNALRSKAAPLGANAVVILNSGMTPDGWGNMRMWSTGVAIRYRDSSSGGGQ